MATTTTHGSSPKSPPPSQITPAGFHLTKGAEVEVSIEDKGSCGVWYTATVIDPPPKSNSKKRKKSLALVEFKRLFADDGSTPLTEYADPDFIRPLPPVVAEEGSVFAVDDIVDASYSDGWWTGIVRKVLEGHKYRVYFDNPPDVIDFSGEDLRYHLKLARGSWSRVLKHGLLQAPESKFSSGTDVEVFDKERFQDIWFPAIIVKENENNTFTVKFRTLRAGDVAVEEKVIIDSQCIRPVPAHDVDRKFELLEKVDAVYDGGWRSGVITKVLAGGRYNVFFKQGNEDRELSHSDVRPRLDCTGNNWVCKAKEVTIAYGNQEHSRTSKDAGNHVIDEQLKGSAMETDNTEDQTPCTVKLRKRWTRKLTPSTEDPILLAVVSPTKKRVKMTAPCCKAAPSRPLKKSSEENTADPPLSSQNGTPRKTISSQNGTPRKTTRERATNEAFSRLATPKRQVASRYSTKSPIGDQSSAPIKSPLVRAKRMKREKPGHQNQTVDVVKSNGKPRKAKDDIIDMSAVKEGTADVPAADNINDDDDQKVEVAGLSFVLGLLAGKGKSSGVASPRHGGVKFPVLNEDLKQKENLDDSTKDKSKKEVKSSQRRKRGRPRKWPLAAEAGQESSGDGVVADSMNIATDPLVVDSTAATKTDSPDPKTTEVGTAAAEHSNDMVDDDQPLSTWKQANHEGSRKQAVNETSESKDTHVDVKKSSVQGKSVKIPFTKQSPVWGTIESMEVFQIAPQEPHFSHLDEVKEEYREGSAIGMMVTFAALFEKISKLKIDDPKSIFDSTLESLVYLEKHGFDVTVLLDRLRKLLEIKVEKEQLQNEFSDSDRTMIKHSCEKAKIEVEMRELKKRIAELQELHEATRSKKEAEDQEVTLWKSEIKSIHERIQHAQNNFANAASAPWKSP